MATSPHHARSTPLAGEPRPLRASLVLYALVVLGIVAHLGSGRTAPRPEISALPSPGGTIVSGAFPDKDRTSSKRGVVGDAPRPLASTRISTSRALSLIEGVVLDTRGHPVPGARLSLLSLRSEPARVETELADSVREESADADGRFALAAPPGDFALYASDHARASALLEPLALHPGESLSGLELVLDASAVVEGLVVNADGTPAAASVEVRLAGRGVSLRTVDVGEHLSIDHLPDAPLELLIVGTEGTSLRRELARPEPGLILRLSPPPGGLSIVVLNRDGAPASGAMVTFSAERRGAMTYTDEDGRAHFAVGPGRVRVEVELGETCASPVEVELGGREEHLRLRLIPCAHVHGRVLEADGEVARGWVALRGARDGGALHVLLDAEGSFAFDHLQAGRFALVYGEEGKDGGEGQPLATVDLEEGHSLELDALRLGPKRRIRGTVLDARGAPLAHVDIESLARDERSVESTRCTTDEIGRFELRARAEVRLRALGPDGARSRIVQLVGRGDEEVTLTLSPIGNLDGVLRGASGASAWVRCGEGLWHAVESSGQFHLQCPLGASLELRCGDSSRVVPVELDENETTYVELSW